MVGKALLFLSGVSRLASAPAWLVLLANTAQFADQLDKFIRPALLCLHLGTARPPRAAIASAPSLLWHCGRGNGCRSCVFYCRSLEELQSRSCQSPSDQPDRPSRSHRTKVSYSVCTYRHLILNIARFSQGHAVGSEVNEGTSMTGHPGCSLGSAVCRIFGSPFCGSYGRATLVLPPCESNVVVSFVRFRNCFLECHLHHMGCMAAV